MSHKSPQWLPFSAVLLSAIIGAGTCLFYCVCLCMLYLFIGGVSRLNFASEHKDHGCWVEVFASAETLRSNSRLLDSFIPTGSKWFNFWWQFLISDMDTKSAERLCTFLMTQKNWDLNWTGKVEKKYFRFKIVVSDHPHPQRKSLLHPEMRKKLTNSEKQRPQWECAFCWGFLFLKWLSRSKQRPATHPVQETLTRWTRALWSSAQTDLFTA